MASIKSQMKRVRTNEKTCLRNQSVKSELKTSVRKTRGAAVVGSKTAAGSALCVAIRKLNVVASKGIIHKSQAAQRKFKLVTSVAAMN